jgi:hypothetical protein
MHFRSIIKTILGKNAPVWGNVITKPSVKSVIDPMPFVNATLGRYQAKASKFCRYIHIEPRFILVSDKG